MEQFDLLGELRLLATAMDWRFLVGASDMANAAEKLQFREDPLEEGELLLWFDDSFTPSRGAGGRVDTINYTASINLLGKIDVGGVTKSKIDETTEQKRDRRVKEITQILSNAMQAFICANNLSVISEILTPVYNIFDENFDGVAGAYVLVQTDFEDAAPVDLITETDNEDEGTTIPAPGTYEVAKYSSQPVYADPEPGFKFLKWDVSGSTKITNPISIFMRSSIRAIAFFAVSDIKVLTIAVSGTGTTDPVPGDYDIESGESQLITAIETDSLWYFDHWDQDGDVYTANPKSFLIVDNSLVVAYFLEYLQWVFDSAPQLVVDQYEFVDLTSNSNNVVVKDSQVLAFDGLSYASEGLVTVGSNQVIKCLFKAAPLGDDRRNNLFGIATTGSNPDSLVLTTGNTSGAWPDESLTLSIRTSSTQRVLGAVRNGVNFYRDNKWHLLELTINGLNQIKVDGAIQTISFTTGSASTTFTLANQTLTWGGWIPDSRQFEGLMAMFEYVGLDKWFMSEGQGTTLYAENGNDGTLNTADLNAAWGTTDDKSEPFPLTEGATLYENDTDQTIMPLCFETSQVISGFTRSGWYPAGSGILKGLSNTYDGVQITGETTGATFESLDALPADDKYTITKPDANSIKPVKVKTL
jgi:hypothetical protein